MAVAAVAARAGQLAVKYAPAVLRKAETALTAATAGKVQSPGQIASYVGSSPQRLAVAAQALVRSGVNPDDVIPQDLIGKDRTLANIRAGADRIAAELQAKFAAGSDRTLNQGESGIAADALRRKRVEVALSICGSAERYFLLVPSGGIPVEDFVWYRTVIQRRP